jgi:nicotinamidase-related amidase
MKDLSVVLIIFTILLFNCNTIKSEKGSNSVLVIINIQKEYTEPDGRSDIYNEQIDNLIDPINKLIDKFFTQGIDIIYINTLVHSQIDSRLKIIGNFQFKKSSLD